VDPSIVEVDNLDNSIRGTYVCDFSFHFYYFNNRFLFKYTVSEADVAADHESDFRPEVASKVGFNGDHDGNGDVEYWKQKYFDILGIYKIMLSN